MITYQKEAFPDEEIYRILHPYVGRWFKQGFGSFTPPQKYGIIPLHNRQNSLIFAPTGSGKTLTAFTSIINELTFLADKGELEDRVYCVYISPLKALSRDIRRNLLEPLSGIQGFAKEDGKKIDIRVLTRTGDTTASQKASMLNKPPHILITTPESFSIVLTSKKFRDHMNKIDWVIVDEIHALASSKRGVELSLSLERLAASTHFMRIGLSATVHPLEEVAKFLVGQESPGKPRDCTIIDTQFIKKMDLKVLSPVPNLITTSYTRVQDRLYEIMNDLIKGHKTTLIFTNTRSATERLVHNLKTRYPEVYTENEGEKGSKSLIGAHHGSLSAEHRLRIEDQLKNGELRCIVSSTSLELGIDIGTIDLVILLGSPKSVSRALQRIGRSGHRLEEVSKGRIIVQDRDDLVECAVLLKAAIEKKIDSIRIPRNCLDVLSQQVYGMAIESPQSIDFVYDTVRKAYPFADLRREDFEDVLAYLSSEYVSLEDRHIYAKIWVDRESGMIGQRGKFARVMYMTNAGTIPDESYITVKLDDMPIGKIDEVFLEKLKKGDVFVLGGETYEFKYARGMVATVGTSAGRPPTVPSWFSEMLPLSFELSQEISKFRRYMSQHFENGASKDEIIKFIDEYLYVDEMGANSIFEYFREQSSFALVPHDKRLVIEHFKDNEKKYVVFHSLYGRRVNDVLSRALSYAISRLQGRDVEMSLNDNGFMLTYTKPLQVRRAFEILKQSDLSKVMELALEHTEILKRRFRHCAARSLMILRNYKGNRKSVGRQQVSSSILLSTVKRISNDFFILREARREVLEDVMDIRNAKMILDDIVSGKTELKEVFLDLPSPFSFNIVLQGHTDIFKVEDRTEFLKRMHSKVLEKIGNRHEKKEMELDEFSYEKAWGEGSEDGTGDDGEEQKADESELLRKQLDVAYWRVKFDSEFYYQARELIEGKREGFTVRFKEWLDTLLSGTVPYIWKDELIKFLMRARLEMK